VGDFADAERRAELEQREHAEKLEKLERQHVEKLEREHVEEFERRRMDAARQEARDEAPPAPAPVASGGLSAFSRSGAVIEDADGGGEEEGSRSEILRVKYGFWQARAVLLGHSAAAERFRHFALRVQHELERIRTGSVLVTSAVPGEGKTIAACNLALALATMAGERRIALVDLDLRRPSVCRALGGHPRVGFEDVISNRAPLDSACMRTDQPSLDVFPVVEPVPQAHELLGSPLVASALRELTSRYDTVVYDAPPVLPVPDVPLVMPYVGACVLVARAGETQRSAFLDMLALLPREKLIGTFLNEAAQPRHARQYLVYDDRTVRSDEPNAI
jgi:Mrp family chromosome partitioning ATPase